MKTEWMNKNASKILVGLIIFLLIATLIFFFIRTSRLQSELNQITQDSNSSEVDDVEVKRIVGLLGKHILLPEETPIIYVISDPEEVISTYGEFFDLCEKGDHLVIFSSKAIIYRESKDLLINVGPVVFSDQVLGESNTINDSQE